MSSLSQIIEKQKEDKKRVHELESENGRLEALVKDQIETIRQLTTSGSSVRKPRTVNFVPSKCSFLTFCSCMLLVYLVTWQCKNSMIFFPSSEEYFSVIWCIPAWWDTSKENFNQKRKKAKILLHIRVRGELPWLTFRSWSLQMSILFFKNIDITTLMIFCLFVDDLFQKERQWCITVVWGCGWWQGEDSHWCHAPCSRQILKEGKEETKIFNWPS